MSKEYLEALECLERIDNTLCLNNIKGKLEFGIDDEEHIDCDSVIGMVEDLENIKRALQRLEAIDNAEPSEALERLEQFINEMTRCLENPKEYVKGYEKQIFWKYKNTLEITIKQALLKAQEPKHYLKWEDLEFKEMYKIIPVRMGDNVYQMAYCLYENEGYIRLEDCQRIYLELFANEKKFFNDLHLERVE